jgi:hypothetical protein
MFIDLWVATDGITTVRFPDRQSAKVYCAETGWNEEDLFNIRTQLFTDPEGYTVVEPWCSRMDPHVDCEIAGVWVGKVFIPPANSMAEGQSIDDEPVTYSSAYLKKLGEISSRLGWPFRDLAATEETRYANLVTYMQECDAQNKKPTLQEAEKIVGRYGN